MMCGEERSFPSLGITKQSWWSLGECSVTVLGVPWLCAELAFSGPTIY